MLASDSSPLFVGREAEMELLARALDQARGGRPAVVVIGGEAGIGKTRLVEEFQARCGDEVLSLNGRCYPVYERDVPYAAFADLLRDMRRRLSPEALAAVLGPASRDVAILAHDLGPAPAARPELPVDARAASKLRLFGSLVGVAERLAALRPAVIWIEDLQWADGASLDLLAFLVRAFRRGPALLVMTIRTDEPSRASRLPILAELESGAWVERIELGPLAPAEMEQQIEAIIGSQPDRQLVDRIVRRSDGNALFVEELIAAERRLDPLGLTPRLADVLRARLSTVSAATRTALRAAAVLGVRFMDDLVAAVSGLPRPAAVDALREATEKGIIVHGPGPDFLSFRHTLVRDYIADDLLPGERRLLHEACALALEASRRGADVAGEVAGHWALAGRSDRALAPAIAAGLDAERRMAFADARRFFEMALRIGLDPAETTAEPELDRVGLLEHAADAAALSGDVAAAIAWAREALATLAGTGHDRRTSEVHERLRWYLWEGGEFEAAERESVQAYALVPPDPPSSTRARVVAHLAGIRLRQGGLLESAALADEAIAVARAAGAVPDLGFALGVRAWNRAECGAISEALADVGEVVEIANLLGHAEGEALAVTNLASLLLYVGRIDEALEVAVDGYATVGRLGLGQVYGGTVAATGAAAAHLLGRWSVARQLCELALETDPEREAAMWVGTVALRLGVATGDEDLAARGRGAIARFTDAALDRLARGWHQIALVEAALAIDDLPRARDLAAEALDVLAHGSRDAIVATLLALGLYAQQGLDELAGVTGLSATAEGRPAWAELRAANPARTGAGDATAYSAALDALVEAEATELAGSVDPQAWDRLAVAAERAGTSPMTAYARLREAEAWLRDSGSLGRPTASRLLREAMRIAQEIGAIPLMRRVAGVAERSRIGLDEPRPSTSPAAGEPQDARSRLRTAFLERTALTAREVEVLGLVAAGWSNGEIARFLFISRKTASVHVSNILAKVGASRRGEAAALAQRIGIVGPLRPSAVLPPVEEMVRQGSASPVSSRREGSPPGT